MKIKLSETTPIQINWLVAMCEGYTDYCGDTDKIMPPRREYGWVHMCDLEYTTNWDQGGPIIDREGITVSKTAHGFWEAYKRPASLQECYQVDGTPLIAAMRCFVASRLGDEVEVPDELC